MSCDKRQVTCEHFKKYIYLNEDKDLYSIFDYKKRLSKGRQGKVGILYNDTVKDTCVFKISLYNDYLIQNEYYTIQHLEDTVYEFCPYFCKNIDMIETQQNKGHKHKGNPFVPSDVSIKDSVLLLEHLKNSEKLSVSLENMKSFQIFGMVKNLLMIVHILQKFCHFTHYDLHSDNILVQRCDPTTLNLFIVGDKSYLYPSYGYVPYIIDFGFAYSKTTENNFFWRNMEFTNIGFFCDRFDPIADPKLLLLSVQDELRQRRGLVSQKLSNMIDNFFHTLPVDKRSGWLQTKAQSVTDYTSDILESLLSSPLQTDKKKKNTCIFQKEPYFCIELLSSLIILPLQKQNIGRSRVYFNTWLGEMNKIFKVVRNSKIMLCVMKRIMNAVREVRSDYLAKNNPTSNRHAKQYFKNELFQSVSDFVSFVDITKDVHIDKLICSTIGLSQCIEGIYFRLMDGMSRIHNSYLNQMPTSKVLDMLNIIDYNIPSSIQFEQGQKVIVHDTNTKSMNTLVLTPQMVHDLRHNSNTDSRQLTQMYYKTFKMELP